MTLAFSEVNFTSVEWSWSFWLIFILPAIAAFSAGLYSGAKKRTFLARTALIFLPLLGLSLLLWLLWTFHAERIEQAKIDYFMKHENPSSFSWSGPTPDEPVYDDWSTPGDKGLYVTGRNEDGSLYSRPPGWVLPAAPVYCITFWSVGFLLRSTRRNPGSD